MISVFRRLISMMKTSFILRKKVLLNAFRRLILLHGSSDPCGMGNWEAIFSGSRKLDAGSGNDLFLIRQKQ